MTIMGFSNLLNQFLGAPGSAPEDSNEQSPELSQTLSSLAAGIPGGLAGGAAAGGIMALLMSNKSARKYAGKAARFGGAAMLGGLAFKAYQNWSSSASTSSQQKSTSRVPVANEATFHQQAIRHSTENQNGFELTIVKAMIAAARADGHIDAEEQKHIFQEVEKMDLTAQEKGVVFDSLQKNISIQELVQGINSIELKAEIYLASCLVITPEQPAEREHLNKLGFALELPAEFLQHLESQAYSKAA
jgi:uncharacterized membrane protein YebE (DUF533 family)